MIDWICFYWLKSWMFMMVCCTKMMCPAVNRLYGANGLQKQMEYALNNSGVRYPRSPHIQGHNMLGKVKVMIKDRTTGDVKEQK